MPREQPVFAPQHRIHQFRHCFIQSGEKDESHRAIEEAFQIATRENDLWGQGYALRVQADNLRFEGRFAESLTLYKRAFDIALAIDDRISMGTELANMSLLTNVLEDYRSSGDYAESVLSVFRRIGNEYQQLFPLRMMAYAAAHAGNIESARALCIESLRGNQKIDHMTGMLACLTSLAEIELASKNMSQATRLYELVKAQLTEGSLHLMEPDEAALKRLEVKVANKDIKPAIEDISIEDVMRSLDTGI